MSKKVEGILLATLGYVRITNLPFTRRKMSGVGYDELKVEITGDMLGTAAKNNGYTVVVTERGEVWLKYGGNSSQAEETLIQTLCPKSSDRGMSTSCAIIVDCTEQILMHILLQRIADPTCEIESSW
jgi:hypothetical protein